MVDLTETRKSRTMLVDGVLLKAYRDVVELPDGGESVREWIDHPGASVVVPLFKDGSTVLVRQFRYATGKEFLEVPAGKLDKPGEEPAEVARRELEEETGIVAEDLTFIADTYPCIGYSNEVIHVFLAEGLRESSMETENDEFLQPVRLPFADAVEMARLGQIEDAKSAVALLLVAAFLARRG